MIYLRKIRLEKGYGYTRVELNDEKYFENILASDLIGDLIGEIFWALQQDSRATQDALYNQDDPSIREEVLDLRLGGSVPRVLRFFSPDFMG
jgi:hypothetical protein